MSEQLQLRRGTAAQVASFTGAQGETVVDTTNNRLVVQDGSTLGGWAAAKLTETITNARTAVADASYTALATDRLIAYTALTAARTVSLPTSSTYPTGTTLTVVDESGSASGSLPITIAANGADTINGSTNVQITSAHGYIAIESNGSGQWTIVDQAASSLTSVGINTPVDPNNVLSVYGTSALFNTASNFNVTVNKAAAADTASFIFEDNFSARAQIGLCGDDNFRFKVSSNGSSFVTGILIDPTTGAVTLGNARTAVNNAAYTVLATDRLIAYTAITAARIVTLPAASVYPAGTALKIIDESGACSATNTITIARAGSDTIDGATSVVINAAYGYIAIESNSIGKWTIVDQGPQVLALNGLSGDVTLAAADGSVIVAAAGSTLSIGGPGGLVNKFRNGTMDVWQRGTSLTAATAGAYTADGWIVTPAGASVTVAQASGRLLTKNSLQVTGASSVTDVQIAQRIESLVAAAFCGQVVTVQAQVYNNTGAAIAPTLTVKHAVAQDSWSSPTTDVNAVSLQSCANGAWTRIAYTFLASASSFNGLQIAFDFGNNFSSSSQDIQITECDIRVTPGASTGLNPNPPPPELRYIHAELAFCQRYFASSFGNGVTPANASSTFMTMGAFYYGSSGQLASSAIPYMVPLRVAPLSSSFTFYASTEVGSPTAGMWQTLTAGVSGWQNTTSTSALAASLNPSNFTMTFTGSSGQSGFGAFVAGNWTVSVEL